MKCHSLRVMDIKRHFINRLGIFFYIYKYQIFTNQFISVINFRTFRVVFIQHSLGSTEIDKTMVRMTFKSENQEITKLSLSLSKQTKSLPERHDVPTQSTFSPM